MKKIRKAGVRPFGMRDKLGYLFGDFGNDFTFILSSSFLLKFYTDVMGISAGVVGIIMMIARFVDAFTDVAMGRICDRSRITAAGKFKPWILRMCGPVAIASFLIYQSSFAGMSTVFKIGWLFVTYILWGSIFYTSINIPYGSMASAISVEPEDRQSLSTFRSIGGTLAGLIIGAGVPMAAYKLDADGNTIMDGEKFMVIAGVFSALAVGCYLLCYFLVTERVRFEEKEVKTTESIDGGKEKNANSVFTMLKNAAGNRALISIIAASIVMLLAQLTMQSMANYVYPNFYGNTAAQSASTLTMVAAMFLAAALAKPVSRRFGKAEVSVVSNLLAAVVCFGLFLLRPESVWVYVALLTLCWLGLGIFSMVNWSLITDVIDYSELRNGVREDGSVYALYSFARKLGQAAAAGVSGGLLSLIGYNETTAFDPEVTTGIFNISTLVPAAGFLLLALILWFWYPLHKKQVEENVEALKQKHGA
ncbi:MAG: MFS transporter [Lachnospiraceae bacterium]|nr:MFS transporter [Lachnospiraceae bacterium]